MQLVYKIKHCQTLSFLYRSKATLTPLTSIKRCISFKSLTEKSAQEQPWREAASLLIVAPMNISQPQSLGYLMVERSKGRRLQPGGMVFPGGTIAPTVDCSSKWLDLYNSAGINLTTLNFLPNDANIPPIYKSNVQLTKEETDEDSNIKSRELPFSKEIALRLTAIRETFEEAGILICKRRDNSNDTKYLYEYDELKDRKEVQRWQKKVMKHPEEFIELCNHLNCLPDLEALKEWSNWLTPTIMKPKSRFDTIFYMIILDRMLRVVCNTSEVGAAQWAKAASLLKDHKNKDLKLMPPQVYEMTNLVNATTIDLLQSKIKSRSEKGIERFFPVIKETTDGQLFLLPGDEMYPEKPDFITSSKANQEKLKVKLSELRKSNSKLNRVEVINNDFQVFVNVS